MYVYTQTIFFVMFIIYTKMFTDFNYEKLTMEWRNMIAALRRNNYTLLYKMFDGVSYGGLIVTGLRNIIESHTTTTATGTRTLPLTKEVVDNIMFAVFKQSFMMVNQMYIPPFIMKSHMTHFINELNAITIPLTTVQLMYEYNVYRTDFVTINMAFIEHIRSYFKLFQSLPQYAQYGLYMRPLNDNTKLLILKLALLRCGLELLIPAPVPSAPSGP